MSWKFGLEITPLDLPCRRSHRLGHQLGSWIRNGRELWLKDGHQIGGSARRDRCSDTCWWKRKHIWARNRFCISNLFRAIHTQQELSAFYLTNQRTNLTRIRELCCTIRRPSEYNETSRSKLMNSESWKSSLHNWPTVGASGGKLSRFWPFFQPSRRCLISHLVGRECWLTQIGTIRRDSH